ncbi:hypothetical protein [Halobellus rarus]|uniref:PD-(D/E)XK nuclease superfamily protein n=1 Tax=Halobellus rarus TaxID=1126237 RepID=A0ABD6CT91_9EURY|nr:hypothetical protein [Halobellus rarus]
MDRDARPADWAGLDSWWATLAQPHRLTSQSDGARVVERDRVGNWWSEVDSWWQSSARYSGPTADTSWSQVFPEEQSPDPWADLDDWWELYAQTGTDAAVRLAAVLARSNTVWSASNAPFDTDPLATDVSDGATPRGPYHPSNEVAWSRWLAQLLRPAGALIATLFDIPVEGPPDEVIREARLSNPGGRPRRADLLICYGDRGISIEVKLDDENYGKTAETAALVEHHYDDREWTHVLLLPERKRNRLDAIVSPGVEQTPDGQLRIPWTDPGPVEVRYWRDITTALRTLLRAGEIVDDHWAANAYLFCAVAEQQLLNFVSHPDAKRFASPANVVEALRPHQLTDTIDRQLTYLQQQNTR